MAPRKTDTKKRVMRRSAGKTSNVLVKAAEVKDETAVTTAEAKPAEAPVAEKPEKPAKSAGAAKQSRRKRTVPAETVVENYFEVNGEQIKAEEVVEKIKESYKAEGHRIAFIKTLQIYYNFEERRAYYVINNTPEDKFVEF